MKSCTIITCNNCEFYNTQYCKNCSKDGDDCYEHWEWRHDVSWRQEQIDNLTQKIADLEVKLAESENSLKCTIDHYETYCAKLNSQNVMIYAAARNYESQLALTEKALELACKEYSKLYCEHYCHREPCKECENGDYEFFKDNFLEAAKEMMKSE